MPLINHFPLYSGLLSDNMVLNNRAPFQQKAILPVQEFPFWSELCLYHTRLLLITRIQIPEKSGLDIKTKRGPVGMEVWHKSWISIFVHVRYNLSEKYRILTIQLVISVSICIRSRWPSDALWRQRSGSTLAQVMACCLTAPSHYLNQCRLIFSEVQWHSYKVNFTRDASTITH